MNSRYIVGFYNSWHGDGRALQNDSDEEMPDYDAVPPPVMHGGGGAPGAGAVPGGALAPVVALHFGAGVPGGAGAAPGAAAPVVHVGGGAPGGAPGGIVVPGGAPAPGGQLVQLQARQFMLAVGFLVELLRELWFLAVLQLQGGSWCGSRRGSSKR